MMNLFKMAIVAACAVAFGSAAPAMARPLVTDPAASTPHLRPEHLSPSDWSGIRAAYEANRHAAIAVEGGYLARNPGQQWRTQFDGRGFVTTPEDGEWSWGLELVSYGRGIDQRLVTSPSCMDARGGRVEYEWDETLKEWFINDQRGLEHGYTVLRRPDDAALTPALSPGRGSEPLGFTLAIRGGLRPRVSGDGRGVTFVDASGAAVVNYSGLTVFDADGRALPAWFETIEGNCQLTIDNSQLLRIVVNDCGARYPLTIDPTAQQAYLKASNTGGGDVFGFSVAASGDTVVIGAPGESSDATGVDGDGSNDNSGNSGAAYVFVRSGGVWSQQAYLKASNTGLNDQFGTAVAVSGETVVIGAYGESSNATGVNGDQSNDLESNSGAAYVFARSGVTWSQQAYLKGSSVNAADFFGISVATSGDTVVVGASDEDSNATGVNGDAGNNGASASGAAYVFVRNGVTWSQQAYLKASNTGANDFFGASVAANGDTVIVGAAGEGSSATGVNGDQADDSLTNAGAAYVFVRSGVTWSQQAYVKASNTGANDEFGKSVGVSGDTMVVGASGEASTVTGVNGNQANNSAVSAGAAYVFIRSGTTWSQQAYLKASNTGSGDFFGRTVGVSGDIVVVGSFFEDSNAIGINGNGGNNSASSSGAAYVFVRNGAIWNHHAYLKASNTQAGDNFGQSVAVSSDIVVVGAFREESGATGVNGNQADNTAPNAGAAYVFVVDSDGDGTPDSIDGCRFDPLKIAPGQCGCGVADTDTDGDGTANCNDNCPNDAAKTAPGICGCGKVDTDTDGDGTADCNDGCPNDAAKIAPGQCGCGSADIDSDGDSVADCIDNCPNTANPDQADVNGDGIGNACTPSPAAPSNIPCGLCGNGTAALTGLSMIVMLALRSGRRRPR